MSQEESNSSVHTYHHSAPIGYLSPEKHRITIDFLYLTKVSPAICTLYSTHPFCEALVEPTHQIDSEPNTCSRYSRVSTTWQNVYPTKWRKVPTSSRFCRPFSRKAKLLVAFDQDNRDDLLGFR